MSSDRGVLPPGTPYLFVHQGRSDWSSLFMLFQWAKDPCFLFEPSHLASSTAFPYVEVCRGWRTILCGGIRIFYFMSHTGKDIGGVKAWAGM